MKKIILIPGIAIAIFSLILMSMTFEKKSMLEIGATLPMGDVKMENVDAKSYSLNDIKGDNGILVIFSCNTCPFVIGNGSKSEGWENRYPEIGELCKELNVGMVLINSNAAKRDAGDSFSDMQSHYKAKDYNSFYVLDKNSTMADEFGALTTPHVYLFDSSMKLVYRGAIDDNVSRKEDVKENYLTNSLKSMVEGKKIDPQITRQKGCSIKRV